MRGGVLAVLTVLTLTLAPIGFSDNAAAQFNIRQGPDAAAESKKQRLIQKGRIAGGGTLLPPITYKGCAPVTQGVTVGENSRFAQMQKNRQPNNELQGMVAGDLVVECPK